MTDHDLVLIHEDGTITFTMSSEQIGRLLAGEALTFTRDGAEIETDPAEAEALRTSGGEFGSLEFRWDLDDLSASVREILDAVDDEDG